MYYIFGQSILIKVDYIYTYNLINKPLYLFLFLISEIDSSKIFHKYIDT